MPQNHGAQRTAAGVSQVPSSAQQFKDHFCQLAVADLGKEPDTRHPRCSLPQMRLPRPRYSGPRAGHTFPTQAPGRRGTSFGQAKGQPRVLGRLGWAQKGAGPSFGTSRKRITGPWFHSNLPAQGIGFPQVSFFFLGQTPLFLFNRWPGFLAGLPLALALVYPFIYPQPGPQQVSIIWITEANSAGLVIWLAPGSRGPVRAPRPWGAKDPGTTWGPGDPGQGQLPSAGFLRPGFSREGGSQQPGGFLPGPFFGGAAFFTLF